MRMPLVWGNETVFADPITLRVGRRRRSTWRKHCPKKEPPGRVPDSSGNSRPSRRTSRASRLSSHERAPGREQTALVQPGSKTWVPGARHSGLLPGRRQAVSRPGVRTPIPRLPVPRFHRATTDLRLLTGSLCGPYFDQGAVVLQWNSEVCLLKQARGRDRALFVASTFVAAVPANTMTPKTSVTKNLVVSSEMARGIAL